MLGDLLDLVFGCSHRNYSFPMSAKRGERKNAAAAATGTYVVCLDCGREFAYDWKQMKVVSTPAAVPASVRVMKPAETEAAVDLRAA